MYEHLTAVSAAMNTLGWSNYANDHEDGNGQFEQNFKFAEALTTADRVVTLRYLLSMIAAERGMIATFIARSYNEDVDYYVQPDEVERIENLHHANFEAPRQVLNTQPVAEQI